MYTEARPVEEPTSSAIECTGSIKIVPLLLSVKSLKRSSHRQIQRLCHDQMPLQPPMNNRPESAGTTQGQFAPWLCCPEDKYSGYRYNDCAATISRRILSSTFENFSSNSSLPITFDACAICLISSSSRRNVRIKLPSYTSVILLNRSVQCRRWTGTHT